MPSNPTDPELRRILSRAKRIAMVGISTNPIRPSWFVGNYMMRRGYTILPVNPAYAGQTLFGQTIAPALSDLSGEVHMVDIFRRSEAVPPIVTEAITALMDRGLQTIWMQIGVINEPAAAEAQSAGLHVVMNKCPKMEYQRLMGELRKGGIATGIISSRLD